LGCVMLCWKMKEGVGPFNREGIRRNSQQVGSGSGAKKSHSPENDKEGAGSEKERKLPAPKPGTSFSSEGHWYSRGWSRSGKEDERGLRKAITHWKKKEAHRKEGDSITPTCLGERIKS